MVALRKEVVAGLKWSWRGSRLVVVPLQDAQRALAEIMQGALRVVP